MRYINTLGELDERRLEQMTQREVGRVAMRAQMILLSSRDFSVPQISEIQEISEVTVYKWFERFEAEGPAGLYDRPREGRPSKVDEETEEELERVLSQAPTEQGYNFSYWTIPLLQEHLAQTLDKELCKETLRQSLHTLAYRWRRPRWLAPNDDPEAARLMKEIAEAVLKAGEQTVIMAEDETTFRLLPPLRNMWMPVGEQVRIPTPKQNDDFSLYGALDLNTGETLTHPFDKANSENTLAHLEAILSHYPKRSILLIWDQASYHRSKKVQHFIDHNERLTVLHLPKRSPQMNPVENLWSILKDRVAANLNRSLTAIKAACKTFFGQTSNRDILRAAGLPVF